MRDPNDPWKDILVSWIICFLLLVLIATLWAINFYNQTRGEIL